MRRDPRHEARSAKKRAFVVLGGLVVHQAASRRCCFTGSSRSTSRQATRITSSGSASGLNRCAVRIAALIALSRVTCRPERLRDLRRGRFPAFEASCLRSVVAG